MIRPPRCQWLNAADISQNVPPTAARGLATLSANGAFQGIRRYAEVSPKPLDEIPLDRQMPLRFLALACLLLTAPASVFAEKPIDFQPASLQLKIPKDVKLGPCSAVDIDSKGRFYVYHRGEQPILCFDRDGKFLHSWGDDLIGKAHGLRVDTDDNVWVTDIKHHTVFKFSPKGKLLLSLGQVDKKGNGADRFNQPTDVAFAANGDVFVTDGYGNSRVMKFAPNGKFLASWGTKGKGPGEFHLPHSILIDKRDRVIVGDRENDRVQVFDTTGKLLEIWTGFAPYGMAFDRKGNIFVADGRANAVLQLDSKGKVVGKWGRKGKRSGEFYLPHMLAADAAGNLYVAEVGNKRLQKLARKP
jgi:DNA-binding beta-propeller fold protein YncE